MKLDLEQLKKMYETMLKIRMLDEKIVELLHTGKMYGFSHQCVGQEAIPVGSAAALEESDYITITHRGHGYCIAKGGNLEKIICELLGKQAGYCKGKGGSMHIAVVEKGILGANGIVGGGIPIAVGAALTAKIKKTGQVAACFFGDGASNQGTFHESLNLASIWKLPIIFVCENNLYGMTTASKSVISVENIADRSSSYSIPGKIINGNDVEEVYYAVKEASDRARKGDGPSLLECKTYRWYGHSCTDPGVSYRACEEIEEWKSKCPLELLRNKILKLGITEDLLESVVKEAEEEFDNALEKALNSDEPEPSEAFTDVFAE